MNHISLSICALAGAIMAVGGTIAEAIAPPNKRNELDTFGMIVTGAFCLFTLVSVIRSRRVVEAKYTNGK